MFKYEREYYEVKDEEDEIYYLMMLDKICGIYSPFEVDENVDFPGKDELGGIILKFIGGGAAYFKIQREMPDSDEVNSIYEVCKFLQKSFGEYVVGFICCEPHIEIRDIKVPEDTSIYLDFCSSRKNDGDYTLNDLTRKIKKNQQFDVDDFMLKFLLPFMSRSDDDEFQLKYLDLVELYNKSDMQIPTRKDVLKFDPAFCKEF